MDKAPDAFRTISEVADELDVPQHVLRFWETRFPQIKPMKRSGGRRYYRPQDVDLLRGIRRLLYGEGYTIRGVQRILKEQGIKAVQHGGDDAPALAPETPQVDDAPNAAPIAADLVEADEAFVADNDVDDESDADDNAPAATSAARVIVAPQRIEPIMTQVAPPVRPAAPRPPDARIEPQIDPRPALPEGTRRTLLPTLSFVNETLPTSRPKPKLSIEGLTIVLQELIDCRELLDTGPGEQAEPA